MSSESCSENLPVDGLIISVIDDSTKHVLTQEMLKVNEVASDEHLLKLWLHDRSINTQRAYRREVERFGDFIRKPLQAIRLHDLQEYVDHLSQSLNQSSVRRAIAAVKSFLTFGHQLGYLQFDVGKPVRLKKLPDTLNQRILTEDDVRQILAESMPLRDKAMLCLFYATGLRVSEICRLNWCDLLPRNSGGQLTAYGKGEKTRTILIPASTWAVIQSLRYSASMDAPVFRSRKSGHLRESAVRRIVKKAAIKAGLSDKVSCHWLRHAHASHALDNGAPIHLVQATLGHASIATTGRYLHARPTDSSSNYLKL